MKIYYVTFDTESVSSRETKHYLFHCFAGTAKEAKDICKTEWQKLFTVREMKIPHQFHMYAHKCNTQDVDMLGCRTWKDAPIRGKDCLDIICTGTTRWNRP